MPGEIVDNFPEKYVPLSTLSGVLSETEFERVEDDYKMSAWIQNQPIPPGLENINVLFRPELTEDQKPNYPIHPLLTILKPPSALATAIATDGDTEKVYKRELVESLLGISVILTNAAHPTEPMEWRPAKTFRDSHGHFFNTAEKRLGWELLEAQRRIEDSTLGFDWYQYNPADVPQGPLPPHCLVSNMRVIFNYDNPEASTVSVYLGVFEDQWKDGKAGLTVDRINGIPILKRHFKVDSAIEVAVLRGSSEQISLLDDLLTDTLHLHHLDP